MEETNQNEKDFFNNNLNISYIEDSLPKADNKIIIKHYVCSLVVYGILLLLIWTNPFFKNITALDVKHFFNRLYLIYICIAPIIYFYYRPKSLCKSHNIAICRYVKRVFCRLPEFRTLKVEEIKEELKHFVPTYTEQQSLMLIFIKFFFGTIMVSSLYSNIEIIWQRIDTYKNVFDALKIALTNLNAEAIKHFLTEYRNILYNNAILFLFSIDLTCFSIGYLTELSALKNKIRTVETTPAGLFFCLICYPPFIAVLNAFIKLPQNENIMAFGDINSPLTWCFRIFAIIFLVIYVAASVALGFKASNLTNRGTVSCFPYNIVRHPAYISKNIFWILTTIPILFVDFHSADFSMKKYILDAALILCAIFGTAGVYYMRALTEERHLIKDPDYREYTKRVKYRFIPFVI